jgi:hypothetical protein
MLIHEMIVAPRTDDETVQRVRSVAESPGLQRRVRASTLAARPIC